jgi:hypothetical protein
MQIRDRMRDTISFLMSPEKIKEELDKIEK